MSRILVAGVGNIFNSDDGFGSEVARRLMSFSLGEGVHVVDFGIRGLDLAYLLADGGYDQVILVDTLQRGNAPGTLSLIEPDLEAIGTTDEVDPAADAHDMHPAKVLALAQALGATLPPMRLVGCEPEDLAPRIGLTPAISAAVENAVPMIQELLLESQNPDRSTSNA